MTRCNGFCSGGRAIPARRTLAGVAAPSAGRERHCSAAFASIAVHRIKASRGAFVSITAWTMRRCSRFVPCPTGIPIGTAAMTPQTWTFAEQTKLTPMVNQSRSYLRLWRTVRLAINHLATANLLFLSLSALGIDHAEGEQQDQQRCCACQMQQRAQEAVAREQVHHHAPSHQHHGGGQVRQID